METIKCSKCGKVIGGFTPKQVRHLLKIHDFTHEGEQEVLE